MDLSEGLAWGIAETISGESEKHSLDPMLVLALINVESRFHQTAVSTEGARGLMQIRPLVANALAEEVELEGWEGEKSLDDPITNIKLGVFYLGYLKKSFRDLKLTLAAYNSGPTEINRRLEEEEELPIEFAMKVLSTYHLYRKQSRRTY
ncbi:MAG: lytic transglycosylase domain-containing protein [Candidatus Binatia bacterium]